MHTHSTAPWRHDHTFGQERPRAGERGTRIVLALTAATMAVEIAAGLAFGSVALLADGLHLGSHATALGISAYAYVYARRHAADPRFAFGTGKVNALGGPGRRDPPAASARALPGTDPVRPRHRPYYGRGAGVQGGNRARAGGLIAGGGPMAVSARLREWAREIRRDVHALYLAARDPRTPWYAKALALVIAAYALSPIDLIPDFIPFLGYLDDVLLLPLAVLLAVRLVPAGVMAEHRAAAAAAEAEPVSRAGAALVVALWLLAAAALLWWLWPRAAR
jgi:uncharacterized membrane protein YkvA (DUF1232 family)